MNEPDHKSVAEDEEEEEDNLSGRVRAVDQEGCVWELVRRASGFKDEMWLGGGAGVLEQKIQAIRAEKEALELKKCPSPKITDQDSPIDFSKKRRTSLCESLSDDSQTSLSSAGHANDYNTVSPTAQPSSDRGVVSWGTPTPKGLDDLKLFGELSARAPSVAVPPLLTGLCFFPSIPASSMMIAGSAGSAFSQLAAAAAVFLDSRNKTKSRPFRSYSKEAFQVPLGFFGIPDVEEAGAQHHVESDTIVSTNNDDLFTLCQEQLPTARDSKLPEDGFNSLPSSQTGTSSCKSQRKRPLRSSSSVLHLTDVAAAPSLAVTPDKIHMKLSTNLSLPASNTAGSASATDVSSTLCCTHNNPRKQPGPTPDHQKDASYWERRRRNNDAAKRSRDARRAKEDEIAARVELLEQENLTLRLEVAALKTETARLKGLLYNN